MLGILLITGQLQAAPAPADASEEVVVWGDPFRRWDDTTWALEMDLALIDSMTIDVADNHTLRVQQFQLDAVIHCNKDVKLGPKTYEISCSLDEVGVQLGANQRASEREVDNLDGMAHVLDAWLTDKELQLQVGQRGTVASVDIDGLFTMNRTQNRTQEVLRLLLARVMSAFHVRWPDTLGPQLGREWIEYNSPLFAFPNFTGSAGSSITGHRIDALDDHWILQSVGRAAVAAQMRNPNVLPFDEGGEWLDIMATYDLDFGAVAIISPQTGYITERIWNVTGKPTPSSPDVLADHEYLFRGRLVLLDDGS